MRRLAILLLAIGLAIVAGFALAATAGADAFTPEAGPSENAVKIDTLYKIVFYIGLAVVGLVWGVLFYSLIRFRARRGRRPPQVFGNTPLELGWTMAAGLIVSIIALITLLMLPDIKNPPPSGPASLAEARTEFAALDVPPPPGGRALRIKVASQQYIFRYQYPNGAISFQQMVVPVNTTVLLDITANDVAHSWWIPKLGGKADAIPGHTNKTWFKATETGTFGGQCSEYCGPNHAEMTAEVTVVEQQQYRAWVVNQKRLIQQAQREALRQREQFERQGS